MFREIILPIFRSTRLCVTACGIMHPPRCCRPKGRQHINYIYKYINKPLLLHLVGCLYYLYQWCTVKQISDNEIYLLIKYIKNILWRVVKCLSYTEEARCLKVNELHEEEEEPAEEWTKLCLQRVGYFIDLQFTVKVHGDSVTVRHCLKPRRHYT